MYEKLIKYLPLNDKKLYNCHEYGCVSILNTHINKYDMLNKNAIKVRMQLDNQKRFDANKNKITIKSDIHNLAEYYYGFRFKIYDKKKSDLINIINEEIKNNRLSIISMDLYYNNYKQDYYKKTHTDIHDQVLAGITNDRYICYTWYNKYSLTIENVSDGCQFLTTYTRNESTEQKNISLLTSGIEQICKEENNTKIILKHIIRTIENLNVDEIYSTTNTLTEVKLFMNLREMARSRERYSYYINYLIESFKESIDLTTKNNYIIICSLLMDIANIWWEISNILLKYDYKFRKGKPVISSEIRDKILPDLYIIQQIEKKTTDHCKHLII